ncbi:hypothetical protein ACLOJK_026729 [Asimina triloba]
MEVGIVKNEENCGGKCPVAIQGEEITKCIKRRRRDIGAAAVISPNSSKGPVEASSSAPVAAIKRSSRFRGVSRHRWTGRYEAHLWDKGSWNVTQKKKGKQGAYDAEEAAARAYDLAALKYWGPTTYTNFPVSDYEKEIQIMQSVTKEEYLASLRRKSSGFSRGVSKYRGVARHHHNGRWEARIGRIFGNKYLYLGTYGTQEEAAAAYDIAAIEYRGINAVTNFDLSTYIRWLRPGANTLISSQEQRASLETPLVPPSSSNVRLREEPQSLPHCNIFPNNELGSPKMHEFCPHGVPDHGSQTKPLTSPTALSLLLRSSVFRELVEKNPNAVDNEVDSGEEQPTGSGHGFGGSLYDGMASLSYMGSSNADATLVVDLPEDRRLSYFGRPEQSSIWNSVLTMPSIN